MKKRYFLYLFHEKTEFILSSEIKCPKSGIFTNNYWVGWVGQSNFASQHSSFFRGCHKFSRQRWLSPHRKNRPYAYKIQTLETGQNFRKGFFFGGRKGAKAEIFLKVTFWGQQLPKNSLRKRPLSDRSFAAMQQVYSTHKILLLWGKVTHEEKFHN